MKISLDLDLTPNLQSLNSSQDSIIKATSPKEFNYTIIDNNLNNNDVIHKNYLEYLAECYNNHYGYVLSPEIIWHMILAELAEHIKDNSKQYAHLFTDTPDEKKMITVLNDGSDVLDIQVIITKLYDIIPVDIAPFLPKLSTESLDSKFAHHAAFCDAVSPYYDYGMLLCGLPSATIRGTVDDWSSVIESFKTVTDLLDIGKTTYAIEVLDILTEIVSSYNDPDGYVSFYKDIITLKPCGSGHQVEVNGWISSFYIKKPSPAYVHNFSSHVSKVEYVDLSDNNKKYHISTGLFRSNFNNENVLVPEFGRLVYRYDSDKVKEKPKRSEDLKLTIIKQKIG